MIQPWIAVVAPHGATDILNMPLYRVLGTHAGVLVATHVMPYSLRLHALPVFSLAHMRHDFKRRRWFKSLAIHTSWAVCPDLAPIYISLVHTPIHYRKHLSDKRILIFVIISIAMSFWPAPIGLDFCARYWVAPVIAHILLHEINSNNSNKKHLLPPVNHEMEIIRRKTFFIRR